MIENNLPESPPPTECPPDPIPPDPNDEPPIASWANTFQHGCSGTGKVLRPSDHVQIQSRLGELCDIYQPATPAEKTVLGIIATAETLEERCQMMGFAMIDEIQASAEVHWDLDGAVAAQELALKLPTAPGLVRLQLMQTPQGAEILIGRWEVLLKALADGPWTAEDRSLALDLLGISPELRAVGRTELDARPGQDARALAQAIIDRELKVLRSESRAAARDKLDRLRRSMALNGAPVRISREFRLMKRYEAMHVRRRKEAFKELDRLRETRGQEEQEAKNRVYSKLLAVKARRESASKAKAAAQPVKEAPATAAPGSSHKATGVWKPTQAVSYASPPKGEGHQGYS